MTDITARITFNSRKGIAKFDEQTGDIVIEWEGSRQPLLFSRVASDVMEHQDGPVPLQLPAQSFRLIANDLTHEEELIAFSLADYLNTIWWYARQRKVSVEVESEVFKIAHTPLTEVQPEVVRGN